MNRLFNAIYSLRYLAILAVIAPFLGSVLMLISGAQNTIEAYLLYFGLENTDSAIGAGEAAMIKLVAAIDHFIFAAILMIFAVGLYTLFFRSNSQTADNESREDGASTHSPSWKHLRNLGGMDEMLLKVIIMLLAVSFLEYMLVSGIATLQWTALVVPVTIIALAIGLRWMSASSKEISNVEQPTENLSTPETYLQTLERLADLHDRGVITDAELERAKLKLRL